MIKMPIQPDGRPDYPAWVEIVRNLVPMGNDPDENQIHYAWDAFVQGHLTKLWQFTHDHPTKNFPVAYNPAKHEYLWLARRERRKLLRGVAKSARQAKVQAA